MSNIPGNLYVIATPIGNLADLSQRAVTVLQSVDLIIAEDTRHSGYLLKSFNINTPLRSFHEHNENEIAGKLIEKLLNGKNVALISDAGTPLINDPGFRLVNLAHEKHITVIPVPGPSALLCALSVAGQPTDRFLFEGFLPPKKSARLKRLEHLEIEPRTLIFYETPHRLISCIKDMITVFGPYRSATLAKELTKIHETVRKSDLVNLLDWLEQDQARLKGEFVIIVGGSKDVETGDEETTRILKILLKTLPVSKVAGIAAEITGRSRNYCYQLATKLAKSEQ